MKIENFPKISIVTPVLNQRLLLERAIQSILNQNYPNIEYIVIDGGSNDGTKDIIKKYEKKITYWESTQDYGMYDALNKGFSKATGYIMGWLNSDDILFPGSLFIIADVFAHNINVKWITGFASNIDFRGSIVKVKEQPLLSRYNFYYGAVRGIQQESTFFKKSLFSEAGGNLNTEYRYAADYELWCRLFERASLYYVNTVIGAFCRRTGQISEMHHNEYYREVEEVRCIYRRKYNNIPFQLKRLLFNLSKSKNKYLISYNSMIDHFSLNCSPTMIKER